MDLNAAAASGGTNGSPDTLDRMLRQLGTLPPADQALAATVRKLSQSVPPPAESESWHGPASQGAFVGGHRILRCLGVGGMGVVYLAFDAASREHRALKILHEKLIDNPEAQARFRREVAVLEQLRHPNIVRLIGSGEWEGYPYLTMEYLDKETLATHIERAPGRRLDPQSACRIALQLANALAHIHDLRLIHRDIKPANVMLTDDDSVKLLDLGIAAYQEGLEQTFHTRHGTGPISLDYAAPERLEQSCPRGISIDIYALGATLFEMLAGKAPYAFETYGSLGDKSLAIIAGCRLTLGQRRPELPSALVQLVERMLARDAAARTPSAQAAVDELRRFLDDAQRAKISPADASPTPPIAPPVAASAPQVESPPSVWLVRAAATGVLAASLAGLLWVGAAFLGDDRPVATANGSAGANNQEVPKSPKKSAEIRDLIAANRMSEALGLLNQTISTDVTIPENDEAKLEIIELHDLRAKLLADGGDPRVASRDLERLAVLDPQNARRHLELAQAKLALGQGEAALVSFREAHRLDPKLVAAAAKVAADAHERGAHDDVIAALEPIQGNPDLAADARALLAETYFHRKQQGDWARAEQIATATLRIAPKQAAVLRIRAEIRLAEGAFSDAGRDLAELIAIEPEDHAARLLLARALLEQQKYEEADAEFAQVVKARPDERLAHVGRARATWALRDKRSATDQEQAAASALGFGQDNSAEEQAFLYRMRGEARLALEQWGDARSDFEVLVKLTPDVPEPYWNLGLAALIMRPVPAAALAQAEQALEKAKALAPAHARTFLLVGLAADAQGRDGDAAAALDESLKLEPNDVIALRNQARIRSQSKVATVANLDQAVELARRLHDLTKEPKGKDRRILPYVLNLRASQFAVNGEYPQALADGIEAVRLSSETSQSDYALTVVRVARQAAQKQLDAADMGDFDAAANALDQAKEALKLVSDLNQGTALGDAGQQLKPIIHQVRFAQLSRDHAHESRKTKYVLALRPSPQGLLPTEWSSPNDIIRVVNGPAMAGSGPGSVEWKQLNALGDFYVEGTVAWLYKPQEPGHYLTIQISGSEPQAAIEAKLIQVSTFGSRYTNDKRPWSFSLNGEELRSPFYGSYPHPVPFRLEQSGGKVRLIIDGTEVLAKPQGPPDFLTTVTISFSDSRIGLGSFAAGPLTKR